MEMEGVPDSVAAEQLRRGDLAAQGDGAPAAPGLAGSGGVVSRARCAISSGSRATAGRSSAGPPPRLRRRRRGAWGRR